MGSLPGACGVISSFRSYAVAKAASRPENGYGEGAEGGVVATEAANPATVGGTLVPSLAPGIPGRRVIGTILGPLLENNLRRSLLLSRDGYWIFFERPVSATVMAINVLLVIGAIWLTIRRRRRSSVD